jgi:hypothetical protein
MEIAWFFQISKACVPKRSGKQEKKMENLLEL